MKKKSNVKYKFAKKTLSDGVKTAYITNGTGSFFYRKPSTKAKKKQTLVVKAEGKEVKLHGHAIRSLRKLLNSI
jgi:hypothetical protein